MVHKPLSLELGIDQLEEQERALTLTSQTGTPVLSQMAEGTEVPVHLFFSNGSQVSYVQKNFKVTAHRTLRLTGATVELNGYTNSEDPNDWYICGYIGGTPASAGVNNKTLNFSANSLKKVSVDGQYDIAYPYAFAWTKFKWADVASTGQSRKPFKSLQFKPQGTLLRLRLSYRPTAAPYQYKVTKLGIKSAHLTTDPSVVVATTAPTAGSLPAWTASTTGVNTDYDIEDVTLPSGSSTESYWVWAMQTTPATAAKFQVKVIGEAVYPNPSTAIKSLLKQTETQDITLDVDRLQGVSPAYNVVFNPERPLLPLEFMAYGDANGNKSEAADGFVRGETYRPNTHVYNSLSTLMKENRYLPSTLDMSSVLFSSVPDQNNPELGNMNIWYTWQNGSYDYTAAGQEWHLTARPYEAIEIIQGYSGTDATVNKLKYSNHTLKAVYYHQAGNVVYGLRFMGDDNKRLSAWRYESVSGSGVKIQAVYLGPKWEHASKGNNALQYVRTETFWTKATTDGEVITRYLNQQPTNGTWVSHALPEQLTKNELGRYIVSTKGDNREQGYNYYEFDRKKVWKVKQRSNLPDEKYKTWNDSYVRFFKLNPYKD